MITIAVDDKTYYLTVCVKSKCSRDIKRIDHFVSLWNENFVGNRTVQKRSVYLYVWLAFTFTDVRGNKQRNIEDEMGGNSLV